MRALQSLRSALSGGLTRHWISTNPLTAHWLKLDWPRSNRADRRLEEVVKWELFNIRILDHCGCVWCRSYHRLGKLWHDFGWNLESCRGVKGSYEKKLLKRRWRAKRVIIIQVKFTWKIHSVLVPYIILNKELSRFISDGLTLLNKFAGVLMLLEILYRVVTLGMWRTQIDASLLSLKHIWIRKICPSAYHVGRWGFGDAAPLVINRGSRLMLMARFIFNRETTCLISKLELLLYKVIKLRLSFVIRLPTVHQVWL